MELYIDANVFINAALDMEEKGKDSRLILAAIRDKTARAVTSVITYDEVFWIVKKHAGKEAAIAAGEALLSLPLSFVDFTAGLLGDVHSLLHKTVLSPRDAIHLASLKLRGIREMVSEDPDFDDPSLGIKRHTISETARMLHL